MSVVAIIGGQWGDEGKGRIVDLLSQHADVIVRYSGGNNAGHTVINKLGTFKLHLVPAGIFNPDKLNIIGSGVVIDPSMLLEEIAMLQAAGVRCDNLCISDRAQVVMPYHIQQDKLQETLRGDGRIGTTGRGIGPAYGDKIERSGIRMGDLLHEETFLQRFTQALEAKNRVLQAYGGTAIPLHETYLRYLDLVQQLRERIVPMFPLIDTALQRGDRILLEGAQGVLLDVDWGTYPYVTSSSPGAAGACQGAGIGPRDLTHVAGVFKAYATRVGEGPFPTELTGALGDRLRERGDEYGTTTGRARRCGWFDAVAARYVQRLNSIDQLIITKLDILDELPEINICTHYRLHDTIIDYLPTTAAVLAQIQPIYETMAGWQCSTEACRSFYELPPAAQAYLRRLEALVGAPITLVSVGAGREQVIEVHPTF
ncbi:MAG: adenylosuccinate synthase [Herpetosiphonaceae bacterium]|nr:adenylosuccinate synthase [Herpetosiphonaceae bacterium]